jgi:large subunit ribosomal protein L46
MVLSRPPQITRDLTPFEKAYYFYQRRLNDRLALPFTRYFYFKRGTPADEDWKRKYRERQTPARDIGKYNAYSKEAWNDELLVGAVESEPGHQIEMLIRDTEMSAAGSQESTKREEVPRLHPRVTEADKKGDQKSLSRLLQRSLYLLVRTKEGYWKFPSSQIEERENLGTVSLSMISYPDKQWITSPSSGPDSVLIISYSQAAERTLAQSAGVNMNTWMVGHHPIGHHVYNLRRPKIDETSKTQLLGEKTFFMKSRIMAGQADLSSNLQDLTDFKWLTKEELQQHVLPQYFSNIKNMLSER